ncbi:MAG TPA: hypothetical protein VGI92_03535 [Gemmatimonadales bacterium]|jgi:hypothetical protein
MMRTSDRLLLVSLALALAACAPPITTGQPGGRLARYSPVDRDPVGFLVLNRDSLGLPDSTVQRLVQLNLRLFRRNQALQNQIDSMMRDVHVTVRNQQTDTSSIPSDVREHIDPLRDQIHAQTSAMKDTAWALLTDPQRNKADSIANRQAAMIRRGPAPTTGTQGRVGP